MNTKGSVLLFVVGFLTLFTLTDCSTCEINILEGNSLKFKLADKQLMDDDRFLIKKDDTYLVPKRNKNKEGPGIVKNNFLELQNVTLYYSGTYTVEMFNSSGKNVLSYQKTVCVYAKVSKPKVNITCQDKKVNLRCDVEDNRDLSFTWHNNRKELKGNKENALTNVKPDDSVYTCTAANSVHSNKSDPVIASCSTSDKLFGFERWTMVYILAGGGALVLTLIIVLMSFGCRSCKRRKKHQLDEEELRLNNLNTSQHPQKSKQTARGQPAPPEPADNGSGQVVAQASLQTAPRTRNQQRARPPPPPFDEDEEQPPPLPQPRKMAQANKRESPL